MGDRMRRFLKDRRGATSIEYGLIAALVFIAMVGALRVYGKSVDKQYDYLKTEITAAR